MGLFISALYMAVILGEMGKTLIELPMVFGGFSIWLETSLKMQLKNVTVMLR